MRDGEPHAVDAPVSGPSEPVSETPPGRKKPERVTLIGAGGRCCPRKESTCGLWLFPRFRV